MRRNRIWIIMMRVLMPARHSIVDSRMLATDWVDRIVI